MDEADNPPVARTELWHPITEAARAGVFRLQVCTACDQTLYPPRELCPRCLGDTLEWREVDPRGRLLAATTLHASVEPFLRERLPLAIGSVQLDAGPVVIAYMAQPGLESGARVRLLEHLDRSGQAVMVAVPADVDDGAVPALLAQTRLGEVLRPPAAG